MRIAIVLKFRRKFKNVKMVNNLFEEKNKLDQKHTCSSEKRLLEQNMAKLKKNYENQSETELPKIKKEGDLPLEKKKKWEDEKRKLKEKNKRWNTSYLIF
jgi:hypothetical protein